MTDLTSYRNLFRRTGVSFTEYTFPRIFSQAVYDFWHIPDDAITGIAVGESLFLFDERNHFIGTAEGEYNRGKKGVVKTFNRRLSTDTATKH